jgi:DNA polymerase-3 subunit beta
MRFKCSQKTLSQALDVVNKAIDSNATLPVLNNILVKAEGKKVFFSATNLEMVINYSMEAEVKNEGSTTVPAKLLTSYIALLSDEDVEIKVEEGESLSVVSTSSKTKIKCIPAEEFPLVSQVDKEASFTIPTEDFIRAIAKTSFAAANNSTRPVLAGIYINASKKAIKFVATDSYRLSEKILELSKALTQEIDVIIPVRAVAEASRIAGKVQADEIEIQLGKNQVLFVIGDVQFISRLIEGKFPNYEQIMPKESKTKVTLSNEDLTMSLKRIQLFAKENNNKVIFHITKDSVKLTTPVTQIGEEECTVPAKVEGDENTIALNAEFMLDVLGNLDDEVLLTITDKVTPALLHGTGETNFRHIVMPLKIQEI